MEKLPPEDIPEHDPGCYLCPGNARAGGVKNPLYRGTWSFGNDFAALLPDTPPGGDEDPFFRTESVRGICKVLIFSPSHRRTLPRMTIEEVTAVAEMWKREHGELSAATGIRYVQLFENKGALMGCSNPHPHGQAWASESVPEEVRIEDETQRAYLDRHGRPLLLDYLERELALGERVVFANAGFAVLVPFWAVWPFETMIVPRRQLSSLAEFAPGDLRLLAEAVREITIRYDNLFRTSFPYSAGMHQAPCDGHEHPGFTWHMPFYPPLLRSATIKKFMVGYELLAETQRDLTPEQAADQLRTARAERSSD